MVVVTGGTGHLGTVLVTRLVEAGESVRCLVRPGSRSQGIDERTVEFVELTLDDADAVAAALRGASVVYHAAGRVTIASGDAQQLEETNVALTRSMLAAARRAGVGRFVHVGSIEAFPLESDRFPVTEEHTIDPRATVLEYGRSKALAIELVLQAARDGLDAVVCCPTGFVGPPDYRLSPIGRVVHDFMRRRLPAYVDGGFDFVDVRDVAAGLIAAAERGRAGRLYLLSGAYVSVARLMELIEAESGVRRPAFCVPIGLLASIAGILELYYRATGNEPRFTRGSLELLGLGVTVDSSRARNELGYTSRPIEETIADTVRWFRESMR